MSQTIKVYCEKDIKKIVKDEVDKKLFYLEQQVDKLRNKMNEVEYLFKLNK